MIDAGKFLKEAIAKTGKELGIKNKHAFPQITKIVVHAGIGKDRENQSMIDSLTKIWQRSLVKNQVFGKLKNQLQHSSFEQVNQLD